LEAKKLAREKKDPKETYGKAEAALNKAIEVLGGGSGLPEDRVKARKDLAFESRCLLSDILLTLDKPGDGIGKLENVEEPTPEKLARAGLLRILAWTRMEGELPKAEAQLKTMLEKAKDSRKTILGAREVAGAIDRVLADPKKPMAAGPEKQELTKRASD